MKLFPTKQKDFWENLWLEKIKKSSRIRTEKDFVAHWSKRAKSYAQHSYDSKKIQRDQEILDFLAEHNALKEDMRVLDIGAGPGNFSLPLARRVREVVALEPAKEMINILQEKAVAEGLENIKIIPRIWQEVDLDKDNMRNQFDLVFASMTPGVSEPAMLYKMLETSRRYCYWSGFSGIRWGQAYCDLWKKFFKQEVEIVNNDIIYPFNLLYSLGYRPILRFQATNEVEEMPVEEKLKSLRGFFWNYMDITEEVEESIRQYLIQRAENGIYREEKNICRGFMLWQVKD